MANSASTSNNNVGYKVDVDDTTQLSSTFEATETSNDHIEYIIRVQRGTESKLFWTIRKRYREFDELNNALRSYNYDLKLPGKKLFGNMNKEFISDRQTGLQEYLERILSNHVLSNTIYVKNFLDEKNYNQNYLEKALEHVSMFFRSESKWQINETLNDLGWRFRKQYLTVNNSDDNKKKYLLSWCDYGPDKAVREADLLGLLQQLSQIQHEYIQPIVKIYNSETGVLLIQEYNDRGSLRDFIYNNTKIKNNYIKKYSLQKTYKAVDISQIKSWSKQILETLNFIHSKGFFYGHLHSGNILIEQNKIKLTDIHNSMLGLPYYYRSFLTKHRKIQTMENIDVYGFGLVLYEMIYGEPINKSTQDTFPNCPFLEIRNILESILSKNALGKNGLPTISQLLALPFFADVKTENSSTIPNTFKFFTSIKYKDLVVKIKEQIEKRLNDEQKAVLKSMRKQVTEARLLSDEEINKRRKEQKKAEMTQNSLEFPTSSVSTNQNTTSRQASVPLSTSAQNTEPKKPTAVATAAPAPPPPPPPPPPAIQASSANSSAPPPPSSDRSNLLSSIEGFSKGALKKTVTVDKSKPKL